MPKRENFSSGSTFEKALGYSRAVKVGETVYVSGTVGIDYSTGTCDPDPIAQLRQVIKNIEPALARAGASLKDIVSITTYVTSAEIFQTIGPTLGEIFGNILPTNAALVVQFPVPLVKVEIACVAVIGCSD